MAQTKQKAVFTAEPNQLEDIQEHVRLGRYKSTSEFLREAIDEKLQRLRLERLSKQVERYCAAGHDDEDREVADMQAFPAEKT
jgi:Arc/MetJ-type ribon-helix-helix transcriptional regulator